MDFDEVEPAARMSHPHAGTIGSKRADDRHNRHDAGVGK